VELLDDVGRVFEVAGSLPVSRSCLDFSVCRDRQRRRGLQRKRSYSHFRCTHTSGVLTLQECSHTLRELGVLLVSVTPSVVSSRLSSHALRGLIVLVVSVTPGVVSFWLFSHALRGFVVLTVSVTPSVVSSQLFSHALHGLIVHAVSITPCVASSRLFSHILRGLVILAVSLTPSMVSSRLFSHALRGLIVLCEWWLQRRSRGQRGFFFCLIILAYDLFRSWRRKFCPVFLSAVRAVTARCKLPLCPPPGPPERLLRTKEIDKGKDRRKAPPVPYFSPADAMKGGVGRNSGSSPAPSASASTLRSSSRSQRSRSSHSGGQRGRSVERDNI